MSNTTDMIDSLESNIQKLIKKIEVLESMNKELKSELNKSVAINQEQVREIKLLNDECATLRMANSLLGSNNYNRETKLKINSLIREIDYCIAQLSD